MTTGKDCNTCSETGCSAKNRKSDETDQQFAERQAIQSRLCQVKHIVMVLSGKGGVGKSTIAANVAMALAMKDKAVGLLDIDIHGPSIPKLFNLVGEKVKATKDYVYPVGYSEYNLKIMSIDFMLPDKDTAIIWRGPLKYQAIKQLLRDTEWGKLDFLIVDSPPGTGDEPLTIAQLLPQADGALIVTTPQDLSIIDVRKSINFARKVGLKVIGVIENMSGFICPHCNKEVDIFKSGGGKKMALDMNVPYLGRIPIDPELTNASDSGKPYTRFFEDSHTRRSFDKIVQTLIEL